MSQAEVQRWQIGWLALIVQVIMLGVFCWWRFSWPLYLNYPVGVLAGIPLAMAMLMRRARLRG